MNSQVTVHILDLHTGNVGSVAKAFHSLGVNATITHSKADLEKATHLVLPGIGHYGKAMELFVQLGLLDAVLKHINGNKAFLGICLGMQLLSTYSEEGNCNGLGVFDARVEQLKVSDSTQFKIPHNGWNTIEKIKNCPLLANITETDEFFFLHKFVWNSIHQTEVFATTDYETTFPSVVGSGNCWGVQFHPEKSHEAGLQVLKNFISL